MNSRSISGVIAAIRSLTTGVLVFNICIFAQVDVYDTGGPLMSEQAAYDVSFYELDLAIDPAARSISGTLTVLANIINPIDQLVLDLDPLLTVDSIFTRPATQLTYAWQGSKLWIALPDTLPAGDSVSVIIAYHGQPHVAANPPWGGGFNWSTTPTGQPWYGVSCEGEGADIWWPCKDHPSDEPDSVALHFTVPDSLLCISNGRLREVIDNGNGTRTFHWFVSTPINNYNVTFNIAPFMELSGTYTSITGETVPVYFWSIPEDYATAQAWFPQLNATLAFMETYFGPYPFRADKYGVVQTAYLGMEHQTAISWGDDFQLNGYGFDYILTHETAHEWWGNMVTAADWKDIWIHESFATYAEALCAEYLSDRDSYHSYTNHWTAYNWLPLAPDYSQTFDQIYNHDIYHKGALVLHNLRYLLGDTDFFTLLRRMAYLTPASEDITSGAHCRLVDSQDFIDLTENISATELDWFFDLYLRQPGLPTLVYSVANGELGLHWETPENQPFYMPVEVAVGPDTLLVDMNSGAGSVFVGTQSFEIDPLDWILKSGIVVHTDDTQNDALPLTIALHPNFPNPFNAGTTIKYDLPEQSQVRLTVYDLVGRTVATLVSEMQPAGRHTIDWDASGISSGTYFYQLQTGNGRLTNKLLIIK